MKVAVCLKQVPAREWHPRVDERRTWIDDADASFELNEADGYALEAGLTLRDQHGGEVVAVVGGPARAAQVARDALARGADRAVHVTFESSAAIDGLAVARGLADVLAPEAFDLLLAGTQSSDVGASVTGIALAEYLGLPHTSLALEMQVERTSLRVKRELEDGWCQWVSMALPALVTVQSGRTPLRYATLKGIMAAKKKELRTVVGALPPASAAVVSLAPPARRKTTRMLEGSPESIARDLVHRLKTEARLL